MIAIRTESGFLELGRDTQIEFNINSPLFLEGDKVKGNYTLDFSLPYTEKNAALLNHPDVVENGKQFIAKQSVQIFVDNAPYKRGVLTIKSVGRKTISVNFTEGLATIAEVLKTTALKDLVNYQYNVAITQNVGKWATVKYVGPTTGEIKIKVNGLEKSSTIVAGNVTTSVQNIATSINAELGLTAVYQSVNMIKIGLEGTLDIEAELHIEPGDPENWELYTTFLTQFNTDYKAWLNQWLSATPPDDIICWPLIHNPNFIDSDFFYNIINTFGYSAFFGNFPSLTNSPTFQTIAPYPKLKWLIEQVESGLGMTIVTPLKDAELDNLYYYHAKHLAFLQKFVGENEFPFWKTSFNVADLLPDIKINEFLKQIAEIFNLAIDYDERSNTIQMLPREAVFLDKSYKDITAISGPVENLENEPQKGIVIFSEFDEDPETPYPRAVLQENDPYAAYVVGDGEQEIILKVSGVRQIVIQVPGLTDINTDTWPILYATHEENEDLGMKLFFYNGVLSNSVGGKYGFGSIANDHYSLSFHGTNGLYEKWWKYWAHFLQRRAHVDRKVDFGLADLATLNILSKYRIDRVNYLLKSVRVVATMRGLKVADVEAYKT